MQYNCASHQVIRAFLEKKLTLSTRRQWNGHGEQLEGSVLTLSFTAVRLLVWAQPHVATAGEALVSVSPTWDTLGSRRGYLCSWAECESQEVGRAGAWGTCFLPTSRHSAPLLTLHHGERLGGQGKWRKAVGGPISSTGREVTSLLEGRQLINS